MKYLVVLGDGMADRPIEELGETPLHMQTPQLWIDFLSCLRLEWYLQFLKVCSRSDTANLQC